METVIKVRKKGIIILPKKVRKLANVSEGDDILLRVEDKKIILEKIQPLRVKVDLEKVEKIESEELELEEKKIEEIVRER